MKEPKHFSKEDIFYSFFGALFMGFVFILKGLMIEVIKNLTSIHLILIIISTIILITVQIYYVGYVHVREKDKRKFGQFWTKRFLTVYIISILTSLFLIYLYRIDLLLGEAVNVFKAIVALSMPCALGATVSDLLRKIKV